MAPLHAFKDQIVAGLEAEVQMRHDTRLIGDDLDQVVVESGRVERGKAQTRQIRHQGQQPTHQIGQARPARQIAAIGGDIDAGQHHLAVAAGDQRAHLVDNRAQGQ